ncbi:hypothetical protein [Dokdonia sp.]|uniref:hypothetical protein n=1 Tax=Dokdonia sp. TaxID=2024995 RepID=UPI00326461F7
MEVEFTISEQKIGESNFKFILNKKLLDNELRIDFDYCWLISLQIFERNEEQLPSEKEEEILMSLFQKIIVEIIDDSEIRIVGTMSGEVFEIFFYGKESDTSKIGGCIVEMKNGLEDREGRFIQWSGKKDKKWKTVSRIYNHFFKT